MKKYPKLLFTIIYGVLFIQINLQNTFGQCSNWIWAKNVSGGIENANISTDIFGNVIVSGNFISPTITFGSYMLTNSGTNTWNACLAKYDSAGNVIWARNAWGTSTTYDVTTDASGNVYMTGKFDSPAITFGGVTLTKLGNIDVFIVKYDPAGNVLWAKSAGATGNSSVGSSVVTDTFGNIYLTGIFNSMTLVFGSDTIYGFNNNWSIFLVRYDISGNEIWAESVATSSIVHKIITDVSGNVYMTGYYYSSILMLGSTMLNNFGDQDIFLAKFDSSGNVLWAKGAGGSSVDQGFSLVTDYLENVYISGIFMSPVLSFGSWSLPNTGCMDDIFISKFDSSGNQLWAKKFGSAFDDRTGSGGLSTDVSGNLFMSGGFSSFGCGSGPIVFGSFVLSEPGAWDPMFVTKFDQNGNVLCATSLPSGGNDDDYPNSVSADALGNVYVSADWGGNPFIVGTDTLYDTTGGEDVFVARLEFSSGTNISEINNNDEIILFPNPFSDKINITTKRNELFEFSLYDVTARKLFNQSFVNSISINTGQLATGIYIYEVKSKNGVIKKGMVVKD